MQFRIPRPVITGITAATIAATAIAIPFLREDEGLALVAYRDVAGVPTICYGETQGVRMGDTATKEQCEALLETRTLEFMDKVDKLLTPEIPPQSLAALGRFAYNTGIGAFVNGTVRREINKGNYALGCDAMLAYRYAGFLTPAQIKKLYPQADPSKPIRRNCSIDSHGCRGMWKRRMGEVADCRAGFGLAPIPESPLAQPTQPTPAVMKAPTFWDKVAEWFKT